MRSRIPPREAGAAGGLGVGTGVQNYATAVLRPGLNPADRRLLFNAALVALHLPLPAGVRRPLGRMEN